MDLIPGVLPPSRETWEFVVFVWQFFPLVTAAQWLTDFYPQGKTSIQSRFNIPGKWAWLFMECPGFLTVLYCMLTIPAKEGLESVPFANKTMVALYVTHYLYRAILSPLVLNPSMSPIHVTVFLSAFFWQIMNGISLGGWLAGYGPTTVDDWSGRAYEIEIGLVIWGWSFMGNIFHDDDLREIRRAALRRQKQETEQGKPAEGVDKLYMIPKNGLFHFILYPHYLCEWLEWAGFWLVGGWHCVPARSFLLNEISTMLPRALAGRKWYIEKFGKERVGNRKAIIPGLL